MNGILSSIMPTIQRGRITHQDTFTLRLGHHVVDINGRERTSLGGRSDVLIHMDGRPVVMLELKAPGTALTTADSEQGLSYARAMNPMPPVTVVTNGEETRFFTTYDMAPWTETQISDTAVQQLFSTAATLAAAERDDAVACLLGNDPDVLRAALEIISQRTMSDMTGVVEDISRPICNDFSIQRDIAEEIGSLLDGGSRNIALVGPPLSGKTNAMHQIWQWAKEAQYHPLFVDVASTRQGILQHVSNALCGQFFSKPDIDYARQWLINGIQTGTLSRLVLLIDGWTGAGDGGPLLAEIDELLSLTDGEAGPATVVALDESSYEKLALRAGRTSLSTFGTRFARVNLVELNDSEFHQALAVLHQACGAVFMDGYERVALYRLPRILRLLATTMSRFAPHETEVKDDGCVLAMTIPSIPSFNFLDAIAEHYLPPSQVSLDMQSLAKAFIEDRSERELNPETAMLAYGRGLLSSDAVQQTLGEQASERLVDGGHLCYHGGPDGSVLFYPRIPEILATAATFVIAKRIRRAWEQEHSIEAVAQKLINESCFFPMGDVVGASALWKLYTQAPELFTRLIKELIQQSPTTEKMPAGSRCLLSIDDSQTLEIPPELIEGCVTHSNTSAFFILSHLAALPLGDGSVKWPNVSLELMRIVGAVPFVLAVPHVDSRSASGHTAHDYPGGTVVCDECGIIEPITQAMLSGFHQCPESMERLAGYANEHDEFCLCYRLFVASKRATSATEKTVAEAAARVCAGMSHAVKRLIQDAIGQRSGNESGPPNHNR